MVIDFIIYNDKEPTRIKQGKTLVRCFGMMKKKLKIFYFVIVIH